MRMGAPFSEMQIGQECMENPEAHLGVGAIEEVGERPRHDHPGFA